MTNINFTYSDEECGWVSDDIVLSGNIVLLISLKKKGIVVLKQEMISDDIATPDAVEKERPKVFVSDTSEDFEFSIDGHTEGAVVSVVTNEEPESIKVINI